MKQSKLLKLFFFHMARLKVCNINKKVLTTTEIVFNYLTGSSFVPINVQNDSLSLRFRFRQSVIARGHIFVSFFLEILNRWLTMILSKNSILPKVISIQLLIQQRDDEDDRVKRNLSMVRLYFY